MNMKERYRLFLRRKSVYYAFDNTTRTFESGAECDRIHVSLYVGNDNRRPRLVKLIATCGALDIDDPQPAITVMMPDED